MKRVVWCIVIIPALVAAACAQPFPKQMLREVDRSISFKELKEDPERFMGRIVLLGGVVIETRNTKEGTYVEILQRRLDSQARPVESDETEGRFIVFTKEFLDAAVYHKGRRVTVIGEIAGQKTQPLGEVQYRYPYIIAKAVHLWEPYRGPSLHIGIGVWRTL